MGIYEFTVEVDDLDINNPDQVGRLAEAPEGVFVLPAIIGRSQQLSCEIDADSPIRAVRLVYKFIADSCPEIQLRHVIPDLVNTSEIAKLFDLSRETVRQWDSSGYLGFPRPYASVGGGSHIQSAWIWGDIFEWAQGKDYEAKLDESVIPLTRSQIHEVDFELRECVRKTMSQETDKLYKARPVAAPEYKVNYRSSVDA